jgi:toxin ParE1/3/4
VARVEITPEALADFERLFDFLALHDPRQARARMLSVRRALELLADHPLLGREAEDGHRDLLLARGRHGYIARYRWLPAADVVLVLAVRHQREAGFAED